MMTDFNYKKYSLENLENWLHDAMSAGDATPQEIYDVILGVVKDNYYTYKEQASKAYELLALLNGNGQSYEDVMKEREYYEQPNMTEEELSQYKFSFSCDKDNPSPECKSAWNSFWEEYYYPEESRKKPNVEDIMPPWGHSDMEALRYSEEELNAMCDKAESDDKKQKLDMNSTYGDMIAAGYTMSADGFWIPPQKEDKVNRWVLPVDVDGLTGECYINLPDDLLERAGLKEGDMVRWIDRGDGSFGLRKVTKPLGMDEC